MKQKVLYVFLVMLALAVAVPLATRTVAQTPTDTPEPTATPQAVPADSDHGHGMGPGMMGRGHHGGLGFLKDWQTLKRVSTLLRLTPQEIFTQLEDGQTLAAIAQAQGVSITDLVDTILAPDKDRLQIRVKYGYITQEQADFIFWQRSRALEKRLDQPLASLPPVPEMMDGGMMDMMGGDMSGMMDGGMMGGMMDMMGGGMMGPTDGNMMGGGTGQPR